MNFIFLLTNIVQYEKVPKESAKLTESGKNRLSKVLPGNRKFKLLTQGLIAMPKVKHLQRL